MSTANPKVNELTLALADARRRSREDIINAMEISYEAGRLDGKIEAINNVLARTEQPAPV